MSKNQHEKKVIVLAAGGTGGHINSALALGDEYRRLGFRVQFFSGERPLDYRLFKGLKVIHLKSRPLKYKNPLKILTSIFFNMQVFIKVLNFYLKNNVYCSIGAGGYVCGPVLMASFITRVPLFIIEQNAVMGLTNKILSFLASKVFVHFKETRGLPKFLLEKVVVAGNPIRSSIGERDLQISEKKIDDITRILIFGGSLGADSINELITGFTREDFSKKIHIKHQVGLNKMSKEKVKIGQNIIYQQYEYFDSIHEEYDWCDLIICRAGASTIAELREIKKPVILIPYPHHKDRHQFFNAEALKNEDLFTVDIETVESLQNNSFQKLKNIISESNKGIDHVRTKSKMVNPVKVIISEIETYV